MCPRRQPVRLLVNQVHSRAEERLKEERVMLPHPEPQALPRSDVKDGAKRSAIDVRTIAATTISEHAEKREGINIKEEAPG